jgi:hypothetical protein
MASPSRAERGSEYAVPPQYARLVEFETRAAILGYRPAGGGRPVNDGILADCHAGYFDLRAVGFGRETVDMTLSFFLRLVAGSSTKASAKAITLTLREGPRRRRRSDPAYDREQECEGNVRALSGHGIHECQSGEMLRPYPAR